MASIKVEHHVSLRKWAAENGIENPEGLNELAVRA